jgi:hypothetical protein
MPQNKHNTTLTAVHKQAADCTPRQTLAARFIINDGTDTALLQAQIEEYIRSMRTAPCAPPAGLPDGAEMYVSSLIKATYVPTGASGPLAFDCTAWEVEAAQALSAQVVIYRVVQGLFGVLVDVRVNSRCFAPAGCQLHVMESGGVTSAVSTAV